MRNVLIFMAVTIMPGAAMAHPGSHAAMSVTAAIVHFLTQPYHVMSLALVAVIAVVAWGWSRHWRSRR